MDPLAVCRAGQAAVVGDEGTRPAATTRGGTAFLSIKLGVRRLQLVIHTLNRPGGS